MSGIVKTGTPVLTTLGSSSPLPASRHRGTAGCQHHLYSAPSTVWLWNTSPRSISLSEVRGLPQSHTRVSARARAPIPYFLEPSPHSVTGQQTGPVCGDHGPPSHSGRWRGSFFSRPPGALGGSPDKREPARGVRARAGGRARARRPRAPIGSRGPKRWGRARRASSAPASASQPREPERGQDPASPRAVRSERHLGARVDRKSVV